MTNNNCDILRKSQSPDSEYRVPPINLDDLPKYLLGKKFSFTINDIFKEAL